MSEPVQSPSSAEDDSEHTPLEVSNDEPVIIIGGGLVGLTLALALMKLRVPVVVYERDQKPDSEERGGWAITIHWALEALEKCLPEQHFKYLSEIQVDLLQGNKNTSNFRFLNMADLSAKYQIPPSKRLRLNRAMLRYILTCSVDVRWNKRLVSFDTPDDGKVTVHFDDGTKASSNMVVGCDGARSMVRQLMYAHDPIQAQLYTLPVRAMGVTVRLNATEAEEVWKIDPLLFQGCHPETGVFLWYSTVSTPALNHSAGSNDEYFEGQIILSWLHKTKSDGIPDGNPQRLAKMRDLTKNFALPVKSLIERISKDTQVQAIALADWPTRPWPEFGGRITLAGDAAHAMTMYRGEAYNHGILDAAFLSVQIWRMIKGIDTQLSLTREYEEEVISRTRSAVFQSRQACLDAHDFHALKSDSPLVSRRTRVMIPDIQD